MKTFSRKLVLHFLMGLARHRLKRLRPFIIGVTGSVGKTSTKDAIFTLLKNRYQVVRNEKSYNTEFGLPLAVLEQPSGFSAPLEWAGILLKAMGKAFFGGGRLQMMVLEMGVDKPGDMTELLRLVRPQIGVMTNIKPVHLAEGQFKDLEDIFLEKRKLVDALPAKGTAVLNADDPYLVSLRDKLACKTLFYGFSEAADLRVLNVESELEGIRFTLTYRDQVLSGALPLLGAFQIYVVLPALAAGLTQGFTLEEGLQALRDFKVPPGRMTLISGINETFLIDSSYNASPETVKQALDLLHETAKGRKIAVLGAMNELGAASERYHREVGRHAVGKADLLVTVGEQARFAAEEAQKEGFPASDLFHCADVLEAEKRLKTVLQKGDTVLVKGSQNKVRLERLVKALMQNPETAKELLVRQEKHWQRIK